MIPLAAFAISLAAQDTVRLPLLEAVDRALAQYPSVAVAAAAVGRAAADARETRAQLLPRLSLEGSLTQWEKPAIVYPLHGFPAGAAGASTIPPFDRTTIQGSAFVSWTLFDFGARASRLRAQRSLTGAAQAALTTAQQQLVARTTTAYLGVVTARQVLAAQDQRIASLSSEAERVRRMLAEGKAPRVELLRAQAELARARADRSGTAGRLDVAEHELAQLAGAEYEGLTRANLPDPALRDTTPPSRADLLARARAASPELAEIRRRADAAQAAASAARATRFPELRLSTGIVDRGATGYEFRPEWQAGLALSYPLYTGGQRAGAIDRAAADARGATEQRRLAELSVAQGLDRAIAAALEAHARVAALRTAVEQSEAVVAIERTSLEIGAGTQTDYLDALTALLAQRAALIEARHAEIAAAVELGRLTGDLSPAWLERTLESVR